MDTYFDRYQCQSWYIKLWRRRYYIPIPFVTLRIRLACGEHPLSFKTCWSIAVGLAQTKMNWWWSWEEVKEKCGLNDERNELDE